jgi:hypothetical protein
LVKVVRRHSSERRLEGSPRIIAGVGSALLALTLALPAQAIGSASQEPAGTSSAPQTDEPTGTAAHPTPPDEATDATTESDLEDTDEASELEEPGKLATLIFTSDAPCSLFVGGIPNGDLDPGGTLEVEVYSLTPRVACISSEVLSARWSEELELELDEIREISIPMLETIEDQRARERREQVFRDIDSALMWTRRDNARDLAWRHAESYCEDLELGAFDDWLLPSLEELETLESKWSLRILKISEQIQLSACCLWSSTKGLDDRFWNLDFRSRREFELNGNLSFGLRALCRRDMSPTELAEAELAASPKERKRRLKEKRRRQDEKRLRKAERAAQQAAEKDSGD